MRNLQNYVPASNQKARKKPLASPKIRRINVMSIKIEIIIWMFCDQLSSSALKKLSSLKATADGFSNKVEALFKSPSIAFINSSTLL